MMFGTLRHRPFFSRGYWLLSLAIGLSLVKFLFLVSEIGTTGLAGNDDLMRLQQIRDLISGQNSWFDVDQSRIASPGTGDMHWSRLPDIFPALLILLLRPLIGTAFAEMSAAIIWPLILLCALIAVLILVMRRLGIGLAGQIAALFFLPVSLVFSKFVPEQLDHHNLVCVLVLAGLAAALTARGSVLAGGICAACVAMILSIANEGLLYAGALIAIQGFFWSIRGYQESARLKAFAYGLIVISTLLYAADAPGWHRHWNTCDAYGAIHWLSALSTGILLIGLAHAVTWLDNWYKRIIAGILAAGLTLLVAFMVNPDCFAGPYAQLPSYVRSNWLSHVQEAQDIGTLLHNNPTFGLSVFGFIICGLCLSVAMIFFAPACQRLNCTAFALLSVIAVAVSFYQIRGAVFAQAFALIAAAWLVDRLFTHWYHKRGARAALIFCVGALFVSPFAWENLARWSFPATDKADIGNTDKADTGNDVCAHPAYYTELAQYAPMKLLTPVDLGAAVLAYTPHQVFAGPYHRNSDGIAWVIETFTSSPEVARVRILAAGADHIWYCPGIGEDGLYRKLAENGLAARLAEGALPDWLVPVDISAPTKDGPQLYRIQHAAIGIDS